MNTDAERQAYDIRLRAERKACKLLANMDKAGRGPDKSGQGSQRTTSEQQTLADLGISRDQSSRWQRLADLPEKDNDSRSNIAAWQELL